MKMMVRKEDASGKVIAAWRQKREGMVKGVMAGGERRRYKDGIKLRKEW